MSDLTPKLAAPLTKSSFTQGDKAVFIRDTAFELMKAHKQGGNSSHYLPYVAIEEASQLWDRFMKDLPDGEPHVSISNIIEAAASGQDSWGIHERM